MRERETLKDEVRVDAEVGFSRDVVCNGLQAAL